MTTYKEIFGKQIKQLSTDPTDTQAEGQVWYNSTSGTFKTVVASGAWSSGANTISNVYAGGGAGTQTAGLGFGGNTGPANTNATYEYNGTGWSNVPATLGTARSYVSSAAAGTQTATLVVGGEGGSPSPSGKTEEYNGTSWSEQNDMANARDSGLAFGTQTAFINSGGVPGYPWGSPASTSTESYDGTNWTAASSVNNARAQGGGFGISTAGLIFGGRTSSPATSPSALLATTESYNGSSWTSENILNTGRLYLSSGSGTLTSGVTAGGIAYPGGTPTVTTTTETYDGTSWTTSPSSLATTRYVGAGGFGSGTSAVVFGGRNGPVVYNLTEEYNFTANTITPGAWASGGALNTARRNMAGSSSSLQTAGIVFGGQTAPAVVGNTELYDGTSWSEVSDLNTARRDFAGAGVQGAALAFGPAVTESWNGSSWSEVNDMNSARNNIGGCGTQTAALAFAGSPAPNTALTESWDGSSWSEVNDLNTPRSNAGGIGTSTAALAVAGGPGVATESWDGSSWTAVASYVTPRGEGTGEAGTQTAGLIFGGTPNTTATEGYDGTSWSTRPSMATAISEIGYGGTQTAALATGGTTNAGPTIVANTEEFTGDTTALNYKTLTTS